MVRKKDLSNAHTFRTVQEGQILRLLGTLSGSIYIHKTLQFSMLFFFFFLNELLNKMNTFIKEGCIKLFKSHSEVFHFRVTLTLV